MPRLRTVSIRLMEAGIFLLPLACWPSPERAFSTPKLWLLALLALPAVVGWASGLPWRRPCRHSRLPPESQPGVYAAPPPSADPPWPLLAWLAAISISSLIAPFVSLRSLLLAALPAPVALATRAGLITESRLRSLLLAGSAAESVIACLQYAGFDPLQLLGWQAEAFPGARMRVYGTMGNPAFVAAWLCATLPLYASALQAARRRWFLWAGLALQAAAIFATGSRVLLLALPAAVAVMAVRSRRIGAWWLVAAPVMAALLIASPARPLGVTVEGRLHLARIAASHWREIPAFGFGPGSFELQFARWQEQWIRTSGTLRFAGPVDHAHNDLLEFAVEYGLLGVAACLLAAAWFVASAWRKRSPGAPSGVWGGLASLAIISLVDFPLHRPAEWALFCLFLFTLDCEHPPGRLNKAVAFTGPKEHNKEIDNVQHGAENVVGPSRHFVRARPLPGGEPPLPGDRSGHSQGSA